MSAASRFLALGRIAIAAIALCSFTVLVPAVPGQAQQKPRGGRDP